MPDQLMHPNFCGLHCAEYTQPGHAHVVSYRCKRWTCETCAPIRAWQLRQQAKRGRPKRFVTLTLPRKWAERPDEGARLLVHAWRMIVQAVRRKHGRDALEYLAVFETTKAGTPHLHILQRGAFIPHSWLSAMMAKLASAPIADIRKVKGRRQAAAYVAKYVAKAPKRFRGCKRYWSTQHWLLRKPDPTERYYMDGWQQSLRWTTLEAIATEYIERGWVLDKITDRFFNARPGPLCPTTQ